MYVCFHGNFCWFNVWNNSAYMDWTFLNFSAPILNRLEFFSASTWHFVASFSNDVISARHFASCAIIFNASYKYISFLFLPTPLVSLIFYTAYSFAYLFTISYLIFYKANLSRHLDCSVVRTWSISRSFCLLFEVFSSSNLRNYSMRADSLTLSSSF